MTNHGSQIWLNLNACFFDMMHTYNFLKSKKKELIFFISDIDSCLNCFVADGCGDV